MHDGDGGLILIVCGRWGLTGAGFEYVEEGCGEASMKGSSIAFV